MPASRWISDLIRPASAAVQTGPANPIATAINSLPKHVVSHSLGEADATWRGEHPDTAHLVTRDVAAKVEALKNGPGDELQIWGSSNLLGTLLRHGLRCTT